MKKECEWCGGTRKRLDIKSMRVLDCEKCKRLTGVAVKKEVVVLDADALAKKYHDRVRTGKTQKDHKRKPKAESV